MRVRGGWGLVACVVTGWGLDVGCTSSGGGGGGGGGTGPSTAVLKIEQGDKQADLTGTGIVIKASLTGGAQINNQTISWTVLSGGGSTPASSQTNASGIAQVTWTLGALVGTQMLEARYTPSGGAAITAIATAAGVTNPACAGGRAGAPASPWTTAEGPIVLSDQLPVTSHVTVNPGVTVCFGPGGGLELMGGGRLTAQGTAGSHILFTAMDLSQEWGYLSFGGAPASPSVLDYVEAEYGTGGFFGASAQHVVTINHSIAQHMTTEGLYLTAPGSNFLNSTVDASGASNGATLESSGGGSVTFSGRVTGSTGNGVTITGANVLMTNCEVSGNAGNGIMVANGGLPLAIHGCNILNNAGQEVFSLDFSGDVNATGNWWGAATGPAMGELAGQVDAGSPLSSAVTLGYLRSASLRAAR